MIQLDLLRHGQTELGHTLRGHTDDLLTDTGWRQMHATIQQQAQPLPWQVIYSSPLRRCADFAGQLAGELNLPLFFDAGLKELYFGQWEGRTTEEIYQHQSELLANFWRQPSCYAAPDAESVLEFQHRVKKSIEIIYRQMRENGWERALLICHGGVIKLLKCLALQQSIDDLLKISAELGELHPLYLDTQGSYSLHLE